MAISGELSFPNVPARIEEHNQSSTAHSLRIDNTLSQLGMAADSKAVGDALADKVDEPSTTGTTGQFLQLGENGPVWSDIPTDTALTQSGVPADGKKTGDELADLKSVIDENFNEITYKLTKVQSNNYAKSDSDAYSGYVALNGNVVDTSSYWHSAHIPVEPGDVIRHYFTSYGVFAKQAMRFVCAYDSSGNAVSSSGEENTSNYTVPSGISSVVITGYGNSNSLSDLMITVNYEATEYEPYFTPYYVSTYDFIKDVLPPVEIDEIGIPGSNLVPISPNGVGAYYVSNNTIKYEPTYTDYHYVIVSVKKNTNYFVNVYPRWMILADGNTVISTTYISGSKIINTGNATSLYYTVANSDWNIGLVISEGFHGTTNAFTKPDFISDLNQLVFNGWYACAIPKFAVRFTQNLVEKFYYNNILSLPDKNKILLQFHVYGSRYEDGVSVNPSTVVSTNGYLYEVYDDNLNIIENNVNTTSFYCYADNVQNCSALIIGDSTVAFGTMGQKLLDAFNSRNKTITLLGTLGTSPNKNEGRSGWRASDYFTDKQYNGVVNPFYNSTSQTFDFSYYMDNQSYSSVDFVVLQLGINDLYNGLLSNGKTAVMELIENITAMIDSILEFNPNQKILLNLPTPCNSDQSKVNSIGQMTIRAKFIYYNSIIQVVCSKYPTVRCSHCHLILDSTTDIADNIHPNETGFNKMALEVLSQINCWQQA